MPDTGQTARTFFLVGSVRSGTTLLRLLLGHHPSICRCDEMEVLATPLFQGSSPCSREDIHRYIELDRDFRKFGLRVDRNLEPPALVRDLLRQRAALDGKPVVGATVHHHFARLPEVWPDARFIYLVRDPRDVARSCVQMGWAGTSWHASRFWTDAQGQWKVLRSRLPETRYRIVRFEDLIANPEHVLAGICDLLGLEYDSSMLDVERDTTYKRPNMSMAKSWRESGDIEGVRQVESFIGMDALNEAGYAHSGYAPLRPNAGTRAAIEMQDVIARVRFRVQRYGFPLWLLNVLSSRLPLRRLRDFAQLRTNAVEDRHLK